MPLHPWVPTSVQRSGLGALPTVSDSKSLELERQHAHADQVGAVDALVALGDDRLHCRAGIGPFAAQSRDEPEPYSLPAMTTSGVPSLLVALGRVEDAHRSLAVGEVDG
jgi:hypothetical protein